jgi:hypothetical protein
MPESSIFDANSTNSALRLLLTTIQESKIILYQYNIQARHMDRNLSQFNASRIHRPPPRSKHIPLEQASASQMVPYQQVH